MNCKLTNFEIAKAGWSRIKILRLLKKGVAYRDETQKGVHSIFSHEGDHLEDVPTHEVSSAIAYVKRERLNAGRPFLVGTVPDPEPSKIGLTLAWQGKPFYSFQPDHILEQAV
jgi:hypothetical protein